MIYYLCMIEASRAEELFSSHRLAVDEYLRLGEHPLADELMDIVLFGPDITGIDTITPVTSLRGAQAVIERTLEAIPSQLSEPNDALRMKSHGDLRIVQALRIAAGEVRAPKSLFKKAAYRGYLRDTAGIDDSEPGAQDKSLKLELAEKLDELLDQRGMRHEQQDAERFKREFALPTPELIEQCFKAGLRLSVTIAERFGGWLPQGEHDNLRLILKEAPTSRTTAYFGTTAPGKFLIEGNTSPKLLQHPGTILRTITHEYLGHYGQAISFQAAILAGKISVGENYSATHSIEGTQAEILAVSRESQVLDTVQDLGLEGMQALGFGDIINVLGPEGISVEDKFKTLVWLLEVQAVYAPYRAIVLSEGFWGINTSRRQQRILGQTVGQLSFESPERTRGQLAASRDRPVEKAAFPMIFPPVRAVRAIQQHPPEVQMRIAETIYGQALLPRQVGQLVTAGSVELYR